MSTVRVIYLVPSDASSREDYKTAIADAILHLQQWYLEQMKNGKTFALCNPVVEVVRTKHKAKWYASHPAGDYHLWFWNNVLADGFALTGASFNHPNFIWIFYIDADNNTGQYGGAGTCGVAVLPQHDLQGLIGLSKEPILRWIGGLGHELGHAFGLAHPPGCEAEQSLPESQCLMFLGFYNYPDTFLLAEEREILNQSVFFRRVES
jgi:hypothetical protein